MKNEATPLTEPISRTLPRSENVAHAVAATPTGGQAESKNISQALTDVDDSDHYVVRIAVSTSCGFSDAETFTLREKKVANTFARGLIATSLRAFGRIGEDAE